MASTPKQTGQPSASKLDPKTRQEVHSLLGLGLRYDEWPAALKAQGLSDSQIPATNAIKWEEFEYFKDEILCML
jgi:hypothetical protein